MDRTPTNEREPRQEGEKPVRGFDLDFYVTDHGADLGRNISDERLRTLYADVAKDGVTSMRYDWHWREVEKENGTFDEAQIAKYSGARTMMKEAGLKEPTIILSNPPKWAVDLCKKDKEAFFVAFRKYAERVRDALAADPSGTVERVQVLNELNMANYTPIATEDIPRVCAITREVFAAINPNVKLVASLHVHGAADLGGLVSKIPFAPRLKPMPDYLKEFESIKDSFDAIALDYYPGTWHLPRKAAGGFNKKMFKQMDLLRETMQTVAGWDKEYEIGETGLPTRRPWGGERAQRYFFDTFFRAFGQTLEDFRARGLRLPSKVGFYQAIDEQPQNTAGRIMRLLTPTPENDFGMRTSEGKRKLILEGNLHNETPRENISQLQKIIRYLTGKQLS